MALSGSTSVAFTKYDTLKFSWSATQSIGNNSSTVSWKLELIAVANGRISSSVAKDYTIVVNGTTYTGTNYIGIGNNETKTLASGTTTIAHNSDGSKTFSYSFNQEIAITFSGSYISNCSGSGTGTLDTIARYAKITGAGSFTDETNALFYYSNPAGNAVTKLEVAIYTPTYKPLADYREISKTGSSYTFHFTDAERAALRAYCAEKTSDTVYYYLRTMIGTSGNLVRLAKTVTIVNCTPTLSPTAVDKLAAAIALTGDANNKLIKEYNSMSVAANATAYKGATIKSYKISCGSKSINSASGTLSNVSSGTFTFSVTDSRGLTATKTLNKTLINYLKPTIVLEVNKPTTSGALTGKVSGNYFNGSFGAVSNTYTIQYRIKTNEGSYGSWTNLTPSLSGNTYTANISITGLEYKNKYTLQARITDRLNTATSDEIATKTTPVFDWGKSEFSFNVPVTFPHGASEGIFTYNSNGDKVYVLQPSNDSNNLVLGYGNYSKKLGDTNIYGDGINLTANTDIMLNGAGSDGVLIASSNYRAFLQAPNRVTVESQGDTIVEGNDVYISSYPGEVSINGINYGVNNVLWSSGGYAMSASQTATLSQNVSSQAHGIILVFSYYNNNAGEDSHFVSFFVPKELIASFSGKGMVFTMRRHMVFAPCTKYLYITNTKITGHGSNWESGTANVAADVMWQNNTFVLRRVIGV